MKIKEFIQEFKDKKVQNTKLNEHAVENYLREKLNIVEYVPFAKKMDIIDNIVSEIIKEVDGVKKVNNIAQYMAFINAMLLSHTSLEFEDGIEDYDELNQYGLIEQIIALFQKDYVECETLLKMAVANELEDNNLNVIIGKFLNGILAQIDGFSEKIKGLTQNLDLPKLLGANMKEEDIAKILGLVDKLNK